MGNREDISKKIYPSDKLQQSYEIVLTVMVFSPGGDIGESDASIRSEDSSNTSSSDDW